MKKISTIIFFLIVAAGFVLGQKTSTEQTGHKSKKIDSLEALLKVYGEDSNKVNVLNRLATLYRHSSAKKSEEYARRAIQISGKISYYKGQAEGYNKLGILMEILARFDKAIVCYDSAQWLFEKTRNKKGVAMVLSNKGNVYRVEGLFEKSLDHYLKALKIRESIGDMKGISESFNTLGDVFDSYGKFDEAIFYFRKALTAALKIGNKEGVAIPSANIGRIYKELGRSYSAHFYLNKANAIGKDIENKKITAYTMINLAALQSDMGDYKTAMENYTASIVQMREMNDVSGTAYCLGGIGDIYFIRKNYTTALQYQDSSLQIALMAGLKELQSDTYKAISQTYAGKGDYVQAYEFHKRYSEVRDSLLNEENTRQITEMQTRYETEKKDKELIKKDAEIVKRNVESAKHETERNAFIVGFAMMLALVFFVFRGYRQKQKANEKIIQQKNIIEVKQKEILDSIHYAKRIQRSRLTSEKYIARQLSSLSEKKPQK